VSGDPSGYRTYEVYQRERVGESTAKIQPRQLSSAQYLTDPYSLLKILRENYPCYRDWPGNAFWLTRYDDVTSVFVDDANFETRPKRWFYGLAGYGRDLGDEHAVLTQRARRDDELADKVANGLVDRFVDRGEVDLAVAFAARYPLELLVGALALPAADVPAVIQRYVQMQRGWLWEPNAQRSGRRAIEELTAYFEPLLKARRADPGDDLISVIGGLDRDDGPATAADVVVTLLEEDHETLHGALANLWCLLLNDPEQLDHVRTNRRMVKHAYLETLRHSTPVLAARRFARHEVERFGRLLPHGALLICSAAAANRDPRVFADPDRFIVGRKDLCQREPRGMYRADGLPAGVAFGFGKPSKFPAVPEDRPRSRYAITRDVASIATNVLLDRLPGVRLATGAEPTLRSLRLGEMHTCWRLPVVFDAP
jgi:cytochrome P450